MDCLRKVPHMTECAVAQHYPLPKHRNRRFDRILQLRALSCCYNFLPITPRQPRMFQEAFPVPMGEQTSSQRNFRTIINEGRESTLQLTDDHGHNAAIDHARGNGRRFVILHED